MTNFVTDTFTATGGTGSPPRVALNTYASGETGHTWNCSSDILLRTDTDVVGCQSANAYDHATASIAPASADYSSVIDVTVLSTADFTAAGPGARISGANRNSGYFASVDPNDAQLRLERFDAGTRTPLGTPYDLSGLLGALPASLVDVEVKCEGDQISALLNGTVVVGPVTDTTYASAGLSGFYIRSGSVFNDLTVDNFSADTLAAGGPTLSSIPATAFPGQSRTVTGTGFGATQGTGGLTIGGVSQTITSWSDTSITFTTVLGVNSYGTGKTLEVTTDAATTVSDTIEMVADTANGFGYVDMSSPNTSDESSVAFGATPTVVTGDQFEWEDFNNLGNLTVDAQGFVTNVDTEGTFRGRFWDATDSTWGAVETFNATIPESAPAFAPDVGIISKTDTTGTIPFSYIGGDADSFEHSTDGGSTWNTVTSPISRTGLTAETTYSGLIRAVNTGGSGPTSSYSFTTNAVGVVDNWPFGKGINPAATKNWEWGKRHPKTGMRVRVYK